MFVVLATSGINNQQERGPPQETLWNYGIMESVVKIEAVRFFVYHQKSEGSYGL